MLAAVFTTFLAFSASALAYTTPTTFNVTSNPVYKPNQGDVIPAGKPYEITWGPSEAGTVSIILLRGPATNILPLYPIVEKIPNKGSYTWTPSTDLVPDVTRYGIQVINDANGQYQYSTQFGISNANYVSSASSSAAATSTHSSYVAASSSAAGYPTSVEPTTTSYATVYSTTKSTVISVVTVATTSASTMNTVPYKPSVVPSAPSYGNSTQPSLTITPLPSATGAASSLKVGSGLLAAVAGVAAMLL
ncbi:hypothetical protein ABW21_db0200746 [Orbilia brochopaga]|nr:hypothetical protein ABW21_db0200746 [Drechslerella brochopaga]